MRGEKSKCSLEFYVILSVTIENICKQIIPATKFVIRLAIANLRKLLDMISDFQPVISGRAYKISTSVRPLDFTRLFSSWVLILR